MISHEGSNCWCSTTSDKVSFLVDGADYFETFVQAARQAQHAIYIACWDIDSRVVLDRRDRFSDEIPALGDFLNQLAEKKKALHVYILAWDFPLMYLRERQWLPRIHLGWKTHRRVHFELDSEHPIGGSQHEKIVVIDDRIAFCGGLDLTKDRWDTPAHAIDDPRRKDSQGHVYTPFHDVQMVVSGETARTLGMRFRARWHKAVGRVLPIPSNGSAVQWPPGVGADIDTHCPICIARTLPAYKNQAAINETLRLYIDAIEAARHYIYIENQYLTVSKVCAALGKRLREATGPQIVLVLPQKASGWLEQSTMDAIRRHQLQKLTELDRHNHLAIYYPVGDDGRTPIYVHAKLMVVDDCFAVVGSANLSNRSMGLDLECSLALESQPGDDIQKALTHFRQRLLAEHLGVSPEKVADCETRQGALIPAIESLRHAGGTLLPLDGDAEPIIDGTAWIPDDTYLDPEEPLMLDRMVDHFTDVAQSQDSGVSPVLKIIIMVLGLLAMAAVWRWTPLSDILSADHMARWAGLVNAVPLLIPLIIAGFAIGGLLFVPVTMMVGATALILPPWQSFLCAISGALLNAAVTYQLGHLLGQKTVQKLAGDKLNRINPFLARKGMVTMAIVRNLPVAPYTVVNIVAGTMGIRFSHYLIGTALGMFPGILAITVFTDRILTVIQDPNWTNIAIAIGIAGVLTLGLWYLRKRLRQREELSNP